MIKFLTLLNLSGILLFNTFFLTNVVITHETPATMQAGTEVKVTVTIDKGSLNGFAKLQIDLPEGLAATAIETKGASFTFADGKAKFIWMALPNQPQFKVSYTLGAAADASGSLPINGKFSYIEDNERKTEDLATTTVTITGGTVAQDNSAPPTPDASATAPVVPDNSSDVTFAGAAAPIKDAEIVNESGVAPQQGAGGVMGTRSISAITETEMLVEVVVNKGDIRGFGKLQETIPAGFTALEKNSNEAIFTTQDRIVKFVWLNLPAAKELKVVYKLRANGQPDGEYTVNGEFGYLLNDETQKAVLGSTNFFTGPKALETQPVATHTEPAKTEPAKTEPVKTTVSKNDGATAQKEKPKSKPKTTSKVTGPETGVTYKVQIMAAHREVGGEYFDRQFHYGGDFSIERHEGWIKYVTGRHSDYRSARDQREGFVSAGHNFRGPFVTAYNNGDRITVQEALMISNQKWVQ
jgi:cell division septation protein DedD